MPAELRSSGIPYTDDVPWGSHLCLFYETQDDLIDAASRFFTPGLDGGELCVWAVPDLVKGASSKEVARDLGISPRTADFHRGNIIEKLGARNTADVIRRVLGRG